jgi:chemotaxis methyl-accepting protein methylase
METKAYDKINAKSIHGICANAHMKESISLENSIEYVQYNWEKDRKKFNEILNHLTVTVTKSLNGSPILKSLDSKILEADRFIDLC